MADAKVSTFTTKAANTCTFTYAYVAADGAYGKMAINASGGVPVYTATALTPYADATSAVGTNALRWNGAVLAFTTAVAWSDGTHQNTLKYVDGTGPQFLDRTTTFKATFNLQSLSADRAYTWPDQAGTIALTIGSASIVTVGTITTGTWHGTAIGVLYGGTGADLSATGGAHKFLKQASAGATITVVQPALADLSDAATIALLSSPTFTGTPAAPTASPGDSSTTLATTAYADAAVQNLNGLPTLVTLDHTAGGSFTAGLAVPQVIWVTSDTGVTIAGTTTIGSTLGDPSAGWELVVTFIVASTTVAHTADFSATGALALPIVATAGQSFRYIWDAGVSKWKRFS